MENNTTITIEILNKNITLIGTAHVSSASADEAFRAIREKTPDIVLIELDSERMDSLKNPDGWKNTNISEVIKNGRSAFMLISMILSSYQKRMSKSTGSLPGAEMLASMRAAEDANIPVRGIDRPIKTTLLRIWRNLSLIEKIKLLFSGILGMLSDEEITEEDIEELKKKDEIESALADIGAEFPVVKRYLVDERDEYMAAQIAGEPAKNIVAVVGAAHRDGIIRHLECWSQEIIGDDGIEDGNTESGDVSGVTEPLFSEIKKESNDHISGELKRQTGRRLSELDVIPAASKKGKVLSLLIPGIIVGAMIITLFLDWKSALTQLRDFTMYTALLAAAGTLLAGGHILSVLTSLVCAPFTAIHPLLAVGWFAGLTQAKVMKPTVGDFEKVSEDLASAKGLWTNKVTKIILVVLFANIGGTIGTFIGGVNVLDILFNRI